MLAAARALGRQVIVLECRSVEDFEPAFATLVERGAGALLVSAFPLAFVPAIAPGSCRWRRTTRFRRYIREFTRMPAKGGLISYSTVLGTTRQVGFYYVPQILKAPRPPTCRSKQPTRFRFVINLKTAKALGLEFPPTLLALADEVIE